MFVCSVLHLILASVYRICQGDSAPLVDYQSRYDPIRVRDLSFGIRAFALCVGSRLINSVRVLVEEVSVVLFKIFEEQRRTRRTGSNS